jgi:hypothetical protein
MNPGKKFKAGYATVTNDNGGDNYREIAELMTQIGFPMNHSSARNHVIRAMHKFVLAFCKAQRIEFSEKEQLRIARDPRFQEAICDMMQYLEAEKVDRHI